MLKKIIKKDKNEELERILDGKNIDEQAKNLLQGILYKIEVSYKDYQKAKSIEQTEEQYVNELLVNINKKCNKIRIIKISQKLDDDEIQKELKTKKFYIGENEIISYPIEQKLLYAIEQKSSNNKILNNKYGETTIAISDFINTGKNIDRVEVLRDFNGWSWTTIKKEIENIEANLIYQILQIILGQKFLNEWIQDKDGIIDYFELLEEDYGKIYGKQKISKIKNLLIKIAIINDIKENKAFAVQIGKELEEITKQAEEYEDSHAYIEKVSEHKRDAMKQLKKLEKILGQGANLERECEKRNKKVPLNEKIFNIKILRQELNEEKEKILNEINEDNYLLNPKNYLREKNIIMQKKELLEVSEYTEEQEEELICNFIKTVLQCLDKQIKELEEPEDIMKMIYKFRYFMCLPFDIERNVKDVQQLEKEILKTENLLVKKAIENKVIANNVPFEVMIHVFKTRIITLEELYYKITKETEKYYIQIFDENITEEKFEIKPIEKIKLNKKLKIFI